MKEKENNNIIIVNKTLHELTRVLLRNDSLVMVCYFTTFHIWWLLILLLSIKYIYISYNTDQKKTTRSRIREMEMYESSWIFNGSIQIMPSHCLMPNVQCPICICVYLIRYECWITNRIFSKRIFIGNSFMFGVNSKGKWWYFGNRKFIYFFSFLFVCGLCLFLLLFLYRKQ